MPYDPHITATELVSDYAHIIKGKVILVTGVSPGSLGGQFVKCIATAEPKCIVLAARNPTKLDQVATEITTADPNVKVRTLQIDLGSLESVRAAAEQLNGWDDLPIIDVLVNNAGIMAVDYHVSSDGFESQLATNHLGPFLFTNLVMKKVLAAKDPRIVVVASDGHRLNPIRFHDYNFDEGRTYNRWYAYGQTKTANMLFAISLSRKLGVKYGLQAYSVHPGVIWTNIGTHINWEVETEDLNKADKSLGNREGWQTLDFISLDRGVATHVFAAFDPALKPNNGAYLINCRIADPMVDTVMAWATSDFDAERLWKLSEELVGQKFPY